MSWRVPYRPRYFTFTGEIGDAVIRSYFTPPSFLSDCPIVSSMSYPPPPRPSVAVSFIREWREVQKVEEGAMPFGTVHRWVSLDPDLPDEPISKVAVPAYRCCLCRTVFIGAEVADLDHWCLPAIKDIMLNYPQQAPLISTEPPV